MEKYVAVEIPIKLGTKNENGRRVDVIVNIPIDALKERGVDITKIFDPDCKCLSDSVGMNSNGCIDEDTALSRFRGDNYYNILNRGLRASLQLEYLKEFN